MGMPIRVPWWYTGYQESKDQFPTSKEEREQFFIFSPFMSMEDTTPEMLIAALVAIKIAKMPKGLEVLKALGIEYLKTIGKSIQALEEASTQGWLNCWINQKLSLRVMRRLGLITAQDAASLESSYNSMFTVVMAKEAVYDTITALGSFAKGVVPFAGLGK